MSEDQIHEDLTRLIMKTAPKPIPLNAEESSYIAEAIINEFNVARKSNDK